MINKPIKANGFISFLPYLFAFILQRYDISLKLPNVSTIISVPAMSKIAICTSKIREGAAG